MSKKRNRRRNRENKQVPHTPVAPVVSETEGEVVVQKPAMIIDNDPQPAKAMAPEEKKEELTEKIVNNQGEARYAIHILSPIEGMLFVGDCTDVAMARDRGSTLRSRLCYNYEVHITNKKTKKTHVFRSYRPLREYLSDGSMLDNEIKSIEVVAPFLVMQRHKNEQGMLRSKIKSRAYQAEQRTLRLVREGVQPPTLLASYGAYINGMTYEFEDELRKFIKRQKHHVHQTKLKAVGKFIRTKRTAVAYLGAGAAEVAAAYPRAVAQFHPLRPKRMTAGTIPDWASAMQGKSNGHTIITADPEAHIEPHMIPRDERGTEQIPGLPKITYH